MRIVVASGKGGTGKTTVAVNLAWTIKSLGHRVSFVDCDVEEPNAHYFLQTEWTSEQTQTVPVPQVDTQACLGESCQKCAQECRFKALIWMVDAILVFPELCHSCGLCEYICPAGAISDTTRTIGTLRQGASDDLNVYGGLLRIGEAMAPPLIKRVKEAASTGEVQIIDAPPGTSCPVIEAMDGADYVLLVAEPTAFGLHDLTLTVHLMRKLGYPFGVVINREGMGDGRVKEYLDREGVEILATLPHTQEAATAYSQGRLLVEAFPDFKDHFSALWQAVQARTSVQAREAQAMRGERR
jgi:MinD superfamily P-loop ATPase